MNEEPLSQRDGGGNVLGLAVGSVTRTHTHTHTRQCQCQCSVPVTSLVLIHWHYRHHVYYSCALACSSRLWRLQPVAVTVAMWAYAVHIFWAGKCSCIKAWWNSSLLPLWDHACCLVASAKLHPSCIGLKSSKYVLGWAVGSATKVASCLQHYCCILKYIDILTRTDQREG